MKKLLNDFWRKTWASAKLALQSQLEYRFNAAVDWAINPLLTTLVELFVWSRMFSAMGVETLGGFGQSSYLSYMTWSIFFSRASANWTYEFRMIQEIESGSINAILVRPIHFYEFYLGQFLGYKIGTIVFSFWIPLVLSLFWAGDLDMSRLVPTLLLLFVYILFSHTFSFLISACAFHFTKVSSLSVTKNIIVWVASGELFPMDILPPTLKVITSYLPFSAGCFVPVGFLIHRLGWPEFLQGLWVTLVWTVIIGALGSWVWKRGLLNYAGTGA